MKLIILEGIATAGKSTVAELITKDLRDKETNKKIYHFNDDIRNEFDIDTISLLKQDDKSSVTKEVILKHLKNILQKLQHIEEQEGRECIFIIDRFHFSYLPCVKSIEDFYELEAELNPNTFFILLNFENYTPEIIFHRMESSLELRGKKHGFYKYFHKLISDESKGASPQERIYNHYKSRYQRLHDAFEKSTLENKYFISIDTLIRKETYPDTYQKIKPELIKFLEQ